MTGHINVWQGKEIDRSGSAHSECHHQSTALPPHLLRALSISMTTSTDKDMVMGLGWVNTPQSTPANISSWAKHWAWWVCGRDGQLISISHDKK